MYLHKVVASKGIKWARSKWGSFEQPTKRARHEREVIAVIGAEISYVMNIELWTAIVGKLKPSLYS